MEIIHYELITVLNNLITFIFLCLDLTFTNCLYLNNEISIYLSFNSSNYCGSSNATFYSKINTSLTNCIVQCGVRPRCEAINFKRNLGNFCELLLDSETTTTFQPGCLHIPRNDVTYSSRLNNSCGCNSTEVCDVSDNSCSTKECEPVKAVEHGHVLGDIYMIGSQLLITCDAGYALANNSIVVVCQENGQWSVDPTCRPTYTCLQDWYLVGSVCFFFPVSVSKMSFYDSQRYCTDLNSTIASVMSEEEDWFINNKLHELAYLNGDKSYWLGMVQDPYTYEWSWSDGNAVNYTNWSPGQPVVNNEDCLLLWFFDDWGWHDVRCSQKALFVCRTDATRVT